MGDYFVPIISGRHLSVVRALLSEASRHLILFVNVVQAVLAQKALEGISALEQINPLAVFHLKAPFVGLKHSLDRGTPASESHDGGSLCAAYRKVDVDGALHLVHTAADPRDLVLEVDLVSKRGTRLGGCPQRV